MVTEPLATVAHRAAERLTATDAYREAVLDARAAGHTLAAIAAAAGVTRQAIHEMIRRHEREAKP